MALKVGGTVVINDSRGLENITNLKTINGQSIVGAGNLAISGSSSFATDITANGMTVGIGGSSVINNSAVGRSALASNSIGSYNAAFGLDALTKNTNGSYNIALGPGALSNNTTGERNTASGAWALTSNTTGALNAAYGSWTLVNNTTGICNTAVGSNALTNNTTGGYNVAVGRQSLINNTEGGLNVAVGRETLANNTTGNYNVAVGTGALLQNTTGSGNTFIGSTFNAVGAYAAVFEITSQNNLLAIGHSSVTNAYIQVPWTVVSDARDKTNFASVPHGLDFVNQLNPVAYQFRLNRDSNETNGKVRYGFKAQDIAAIEPEGVIVDVANPEKFYYNESDLIPILVKAVQELAAKNIALEARLAALEAK
jgi:trimeric autotransporter adhesin